jgi:hypothetical protein
MALYDIVSGTTAVASDVEQLVNIFNGKHDIGNISFAPQISAPSSGSFSLASQGGNSLGVGAYNYEFTYVTGQYKSDGVTLVQTGETLPSSSLSITTTSGNTTVKITLPTSGLPTSAIAINIYRTSVGGSDYKLVATVKAGSANYTDSTADASRGSQTPPGSNTTGTTLTQYVRANARMEIVTITLFTNGSSNTAQANGTFSSAYANPPSIAPMNLTNTNGVNYADDIEYPFFFNVSTTGFSVKVKAEGSALLGTSTPTNIFLNCLVFGN